MAGAHASLATLLSRMLAITLASMAIGLGLTTYTFPIHSAYGDLQDLFARALGDSEPPLPEPPAALAIGPLTAHPPAETARPDSGVTQPPVGAQPRAWLEEAVARDSAALRGWLGTAVFPTAVVDGDTVRTTLLRITLHHGCPLVSRLEATTVGHVDRHPRIVSLRANCPPAPEGAERPTQSP